MFQTIVAKEMQKVEDYSFSASTNEDWSVDFQYKVDGVGAPINPAWKLFMQLKGETGTIGMFATLENERFVIIDRPNGKFGFRLKQVDASQIVPADYEYDIVLQTSEGIRRLKKGIITVEPGVTQVPGQEKWSHFPLIARP